MDNWSIGVVSERSVDPDSEVKRQFYTFGKPVKSWNRFGFAKTGYKQIIIKPAADIRKK